MSAIVTMVAVLKYAMTRLQVTFVRVFMDIRLMQIVGHVMVHISHAVCHALCHPFVLSIDIDECLFMMPCSQQCHNSNGSYYCSCIDGFVTDGPCCINSSGKLFMLCHCYPYHVCVIVTDGEAWLLYSDHMSLQHIPTGDSHAN